MPEKITETFIGSGVIYYKGRDIGNCSAADITYELDNQQLPNYRGGGGNFDVLDRITSVNLAIGITSLNIANLGLLNSASVTALTSATVVAEEVTVTELNRLLRVDHMIDVGATVTVTDDTEPTPVVIDRVEEDGTVNYVVSAGGVLVPTGSLIELADVILVSYTVPAGYVLEALQTFGEEGDIVIEGLNDRNGKPHLIECWRWKPSPTGINAITTTFADVSVAGQLLADNTKGAGKSKFFRAIMTV